MTQQEHKEETKKRKPIEPKYLMGTKALHLLGDISSDKEDLFYTTEETDDYYIGAWVTGYGFFDVLFPKESSRELTKEEIEKYNSKYIQLANYEPVKLQVS